MKLFSLLRKFLQSRASESGRTRLTRPLLATLLSLIIVTMTGLAPTSAAANGPSSDLSLPWNTGETWSLLGGPHNWAAISGNPWNSLDFTGGSGNVRAARGGVVHIPCGYGWAWIDHLDGWKTSYYHISIDPSIHDGAQVARGQLIGQIGKNQPCSTLPPPDRACAFQCLLRERDVQPEQYGATVGAERNGYRRMGCPAGCCSICRAACDRSALATPAALLLA